MKLSTNVIRRLAPAALLAAAVTSLSPTVFADNPIVQTNYTADPGPMVYDGRVYLFTSHDEDVTVNNFFTMNDWRLYSTVDMVNWTDLGSPAGYKTFSWGTGDAWAPQGAARNGKFYMYVPLNNSTGAKIGVLVASNPAGPYMDPLGKALVSTGTGDIDPSVFIDDDGQAYLYWGNPNLWYVKLNSDMTSYPGSPTKVNLTTAGFGTRSNTDRATAYEEGPWFFKHDALYYLVYPADGTPEKISFTTSSGPTGPWMFGGDIMAKETGSGSSFTNHPAVIDYKGKSYFFYHNGALPGGGSYKRSVCVEEFTYNPDGSIPTIKMTTEGPAPLEALNPFQQVEAETIAFSAGLKTETCTDTGGGIDVTQISNGDYIKVKNVDFLDGVTSFDARVSAAGSNAKIELHLDSKTGTSLGTCDVSGTSAWTTKTCTVTGGSGKHDLFLVFTGGSGDLFKFNWWQFKGPTTMNPAGGAGGNGASGGASGSAGSRATGGVGGIGGAGGAAAGASTAGGAPPVSGGSAGTSAGRAGGSSSVSGAAGVPGSGAGGTAAAQGGAPTGSGGGPSLGGSGGSTAGHSGSIAGTGAAVAGGGPTTGGSGGAAGDSTGCSCRTSSGSSPTSAMAGLLLLGLGLRRRRGRGRA
jgi:MYXO-CTERM domain-containing protein